MMKKLSDFTYITILVFVFSCSHEKINNKQQKPNIIFIMSDDHATQAISVYDSTLIQTPHIDQLANEGMVFKKAFVTNSICAPSRAVILTGMYSHLNGVRDNETAFDSAQLTYPKVLQKNGYQTAIVGKWHLKSQPAGFDYWNVLPGQGLYYNPQFIDNGKDTTYQGYVTDIITDKTLEWLQQRDSNKPFMLMMHHKAPHRNWMPAFRHLDEFEEGFSKLPETFFDDYTGRDHLKKQTLTIADHMSLGYDLKMKCDTCEEAPINQWTSYAFQSRLDHFSDEQLEKWEKGYEQERIEFESFERHDTRAFKEWKLKRYLQDYLRCILSVDESIGRINQFLKENGLDKNTLVVYTSDQGFFLGEHGLFDKRYMYEESFSTPMIMKYPEMIPQGSTSDELVMNLDLAPTFLDLANIEIPDEMQGRSLLPVMSSELNTQWRESIYYHFYEDAFGVPKHYGVRTDRYKLIRFETDPVSWEMYDLENDPKEMNNLYNDPEYASIQEMLKKEIQELRRKYKVTED